MTEEKPQWIVNHKPNDQAPFRMLCIPNSGGGTAMFYDWIGKLDNVEICALALPGRERRIMEPAVDSMSELMDILVPEMESLTDKPLFLFGHSMGALIAYELAHQLPVSPLHLFVSGYRSPEIKNNNRVLHNLDDNEFVKELRGYGGTPDEVLQHRETMSLLLPMLRADFKLHETYVFRNRGPLNIPVSAFAGASDRIVPPADMALWRNKTVAAFEFHTLSGEHFFIQDSQQELFSLIQARVNDHLYETILAQSLY